MPGLNPAQLAAVEHLLLLVAVLVLAVIVTPIIQNHLGEEAQLNLVLPLLEEQYIQ